MQPHQISPSPRPDRLTAHRAQGPGKVLFPQLDGVERVLTHAAQGCSLSGSKPLNQSAPPRQTALASLIHPF